MYCTSASKQISIFCRRVRGVVHLSNADVPGPRQKLLFTATMEVTQEDNQQLPDSSDDEATTVGDNSEAGPDDGRRSPFDGQDEPEAPRKEADESESPWNYADEPESSRREGHKDEEAREDGKNKEADEPQSPGREGHKDDDSMDDDTDEYDSKDGQESDASSTEDDKHGATRYDEVPLPVEVVDLISDNDEEDQPEPSSKTKKKADCDDASATGAPPSKRVRRLPKAKRIQ